MPRKQQSSQNASYSVTITVIVAIIGLAGTLGASYLNYRATLDTKAADIALASTQLAVQVNPTNVALTSAAIPTATALITPTSTPGPCVENSFSDENSARLNWSISSNSDTDGTETTSIKNGKYIWTINALTPILYTRQLSPSQGVITQNQNYEIEVDMEKIEGPDSVGYGLMLNEEAQLKHYTIFVYPAKQEVSIAKRTPDQWVSLVETTYIGSIKQSGVNVLKVIKQESNYQVYINESDAGSFTDSEYQNGKIELMTDISEINTEVVLGIDNFQLCNIP